MNRKRWQFSAVAIVAGIVACLLAVLLSPRAFLLGYLVVAVTVSSVPAGSLAVLLLSYLVRGPWTEALHAPLAASALTAPLAGVLFVPLLVGLPWLYPWALYAPQDPGSLKAIYLAPVFYIVRTLGYFAAWTVLAWWARQAWGNQARMTRAASVGLIVYALTASLAGIDWIESLTPEFHASGYGLLFLTFQLLAGFAVALVMALSPPHAQTHRYGAIFLAAILLWAYNHAMQYIIIWSGNIPDEVDWYARREIGVWGLALWTLIILQFVLPFFTMLWEQVRNDRRCLLGLAALTLALRFLEAVVLALPGTGADPLATGIALLGAALLQGGAWWIGLAALLPQIMNSSHGNRPLEASVGSSDSPSAAHAP